MERSEQIGELVTALSKAQGEFSAAVKDSDNPYYGSKYADLSAVINAVRPALSKHGIALVQTSEADLERQTASVTTSLHLAEQWISNTAEAPATGKGKKAPDDPNAPVRFDVQTIGAAWTYLRRYTLQGLVGVPAEDDDGNSVVGNNAPISKRQPEPKPPVDMGIFSQIGERLTCIILGVIDKETKGERKSKYVTVTFNGRIDGFNYATCFDAALFDVLKGALNKETVLELKYQKGDKFINITNVLSVDGIERKNEEKADAVANG